MDGEASDAKLLQTLYSSCLLCSLGAFFTRSPFPATSSVTRQTLLTLASGIEADAELLERALLASGCMQPLSGAAEAFTLCDAASKTLLASTAGHADVLAALVSVIIATSASQQVGQHLNCKLTVLH